MSSEDKIQSQIAKATFIKFIDRLYKISDPKAKFIYGDMAFPQPDRTFRMLNHLLNYLFYYNATKEEVLNRLKPLKEYNNLKIETNEMRIKLEKLKLSDREREENSYRKKHMEMAAEAKKLEDEFVKLNANLIESIPFLRSLSEKTENLASQLVDEESRLNILSMKKEMEDLKEDLMEKDNIVQQTIGNCKKIIESLKSNNDRIDSLVKDLLLMNKTVG